MFWGPSRYVCLGIIFSAVVYLTAGAGLAAGNEDSATYRENTFPNGKTVRVGLSHNPPIGIFGKGGQPQGFVVDIIRDVAKKNGWNLAYYERPWPDLLKMLGSRQIDLLGGIAFTSERAKKYDFSRQTATSNWAIVYRNKNTQINSIMDLDGKRIALIPRAVHTAALEKLSRSFGFSFKEITANSYDQVLELVDSGAAELGVVARTFHIFGGSKYKAIATSIEFDPVELRFAVPKGTGKDILSAFDTFISSQKNDPLSRYHKIHAHWFKDPVKEVIPVWIFWAGGGVIILLCVAWVSAIWLRREVATRTMELRKSEENLRTTLSSIGDAVIATDTSGNITSMNPVAAKLTSWETGDAVGRPLTEVFHIISSQTRERAFNPVNKVLENGEIVGLANHTILIARDGVEYQIADSAAPIRNDSGDITGVVLVFRDVTDDYAIRNSLVESELRFRGLFENAEISIWNEDMSEVRKTLDQLHLDGVTDLRGYLKDNEKAASELAAMVNVLHVNEATLKLFGAETEDEFLYRIDKTFGPNAMDVFIDELFAIWGKHKAFRSEAVFRSLDGENEINAIISFQIPETVEEFRSIPVSIIDITDRKRAEDRSMRLGRIVEQSVNEVYMFDAETFRFITINRGARENLGYTIDELKLLTPYDLKPEFTQQSFERLIKPLRDGAAENLTFETTHRRKDGSTYDIEAFIQFMRLETPPVFVAIILDITERKKVAEAMLEAKRVAEKANKAKSEFLASMSHELRTPLNAVLGFAQMMQFDPKNPLSPGQNEHVESILEGGEHLLKLINEILDLARVEANQFDLSLNDVEANEVIADCVSLTAPLGKQRNIKIINQFGNASPVILFTDHTRFKQVLINLLSNAVKFNKDGGTVTIERRQTDCGYLRISVTDTGIGIAKEDNSSVFNLFDRLGADPMITREGTGIGLAVTKLLVERMAGRIGFESEENVGSTFWVDLPLASNEDVMIWTETMRIGVDAIDKDHQVLISMLNRVMHRSTGHDDMDEVIRELVDYTRCHFEREEAIMVACAYPGIEKHRNLHRRLITDMFDHAEVWRSERNHENLVQFRKFLKKWLFNHILKEDTKIAASARGKDQDIQKTLGPLV